MTGKVVDLAARRPPPNPGNGAREALLAVAEFALVEPTRPSETLLGRTADALLAYLWVEGFKVVPLEDKDWKA